MAISMKTVVLATLATGAALAVPLVAQQRAVSGPVARYDMRAGTVSGVGAGGAMGMMFGGRGNSVQHELYLRLGSSRAAERGSPKADHFMPAGAKLGKSVALTTPRQEREGIDELPQKPQGRLLIYWGCGERAAKGQPIVIDFARVAAGQIPPGVWSSSIVRDWGPTLTNSRTFGRWPAEDNKFVKSDSSLIGAHRIAGNYSPEISFNHSKDIMAALRVNTTSLPSGASMLRWSGIPDATGYLALMFGGKQSGEGQMRDMVMWTSSASRQFGGGLSDWLTPAQVATLVRDRTVLPSSASSCVVPAEVIRDAPDFRFGTLTAFGPEESFSYPPRPADPRAAWALEWTARVRHRSTTSWMQAQGMSMGTGGAQGQGQQKEDCRPRGLGGMLGGALGGGKGGC